MGFTTAISEKTHNNNYSNNQEGKRLEQKKKE